MKKIVLLALIAMTFIVTSSNAAQISISAKHYSNSSCQNFTTSTGLFKVTYEDNLNWGTRVFIKYAYKNSYTNVDWFGEDLIELMPTTPYKWEVEFVDTVAALGAFSKSELNYIFIMVTEDGHTWFDKGSDTTYGHYRSMIPRMECTENSPMNELDIIRVEK